MAIKALQDPLACSVDYHRFPKHQVGPPQHLVEKQTQESHWRSYAPKSRSLPERFYGSAIFYGTIWMACHQDANNQPLERVRLFQVGWLLTALRCCMLELKAAWYLVQIKTPPADKHALTQHLSPALGSSWDHGVSRVSNIYTLLGVSESETSDWVQPTREQTLVPAGHSLARIILQFVEPFSFFFLLHWSCVLPEH